MSTPDGYIAIVQHLAELRSRLARERRDDDADIVVQAMTTISSLELHRQMYDNRDAPASGEPSGAHQERDADARRLAALVLRIRAAVRERGYLYVESSELYRDLNAAEKLARAIDAAMAPQTEG